MVALILGLGEKSHDLDALQKDNERWFVA